MAFTNLSTRSTGYLVTATNWNEMVNNWLAVATSAGLLKHEYGGLEFDASGIVAGGIVRGTGTGTMGILAKGTAKQALRMNSGATDIEWVTPTTIATGTYTGDGATSQAITGVGFTVKYLIITPVGTDEASAVVLWTSDTIIDNDGDGMAILEDPSNAAEHSYADNAIIALGSDGFTVDDAGADKHPNKASTTYDYIAFG
jgi:hypothetical protein